MSNVLVIGASRGIGLEFCKQLQKQKHQVYATCRNKSPELLKFCTKCFENIDVANESSLQELADNFPLPSIDLLIHNAGILEKDAFPDFNYPAMEKQFQINTLGPLKAINAFLPLLKKGSKIAVVSSRAGSIASKLKGGKLYGYRVSKCALNMALKCLSFDLMPKEICLAILHPGYVNTDMTNHQAKISPAESVKGMLDRIQEMDLSSTGVFWNYSGDILPW